MFGGKLAAALLALLLPLVPTGGAAAQTPLDVLVLGDSYSAGNGAGAYADRACRRSTRNYGEVLETLVPGATSTTAACSGATTSSLRRTQLGAITPAADVVVLTIGGNDAGFATIVGTCLLGGVRQGPACDRSLTRAEQLASSGVLATRIRQVLQDIRARTTAKVVLVGYPYLEGNPRFRLGATAAGTRVRALTDAGDRIGRQVVGELGAGFTFVSVKDRFAGHELLAERVNPQRWLVQPLTDAPLADVADWYHPNRTGHAELARAVAPAISR